MPDDRFEAVSFLELFEKSCSKPGELVLDWFIVQLGLYISPVGFSSSVVPEKWRLLYSLNPMVGVIDGFRWAILGGNHNIHWPGFALSVGIVALIMAIGRAMVAQEEAQPEYSMHFV